MEKVAAWSPNNGVLLACPRGTGPFRRVSRVQAMARAQVRCDYSLWRRDPQPCSVAGARRKSVGRHSVGSASRSRPRGLVTAT